jgi:hypothetical protein
MNPTFQLVGCAMIKLDQNDIRDILPRARFKKGLDQYVDKRWARLFEQPFRVDKWIVCRG